MTDTPIEALVARMDEAAVYVDGDDCAGHNLWRDLRAAITAELAQVKAERDAERALADRLADFAEELATDSPNPNCECRECRAARLVAAHAALRKEPPHGQ